ncbi:MAG: hypothetical protein KC492_18385, partial [Myxococcales bacterium]|nr:hypothetical protein [Myxococcales bacterium]
MRGAVYGSVIPELRRELHRLLAIRESAEANDDPTTLERAARHWLRCDEEARAVDTGLRTIGLLPRGETVRSIDLADGLGVLDRAPTEGECLAHWGDLCRLASCLIDAGRHEQASQLLGALDVASDSASISDAQRAHLSLRQAAWRQWNEGVSSLSVDDLQDAASKLQGTPDGRQALYILALRLRAGDEPDLAVRVLQDLTDDADAAGDALSAARAFLALGGVLRSRYRLDEAAHNYQRARELFSQCHHVINVAVCDVNLAMVALAAGQFRAALAQASGAWNVLERSGARGLADQAAMICSDVLLSQGNFRDAAAWAAPRLQSTAVLTRCDAALQMAHISGVQQNDASEYLCLAGEALTEAPDRESRNRLQIERLYLCRLAPEDFPGLVRVLDQRIEFLGDSPSERILLLVRLSQLACEGLFPPRDLLRGWPRCLKALPRAHRRTALGLLRALRAQEGPCTRVPDSRLVASLLGQGHA